jgi:hypothetical protein
MLFLQEQKMWMNNDMFQTQKIATVGKITEIHPRLVWTPQLIKELTTAMQGTKMPATDIAKWRAQTQVIEIDAATNVTPVPPFHLVPRNFGWGNGQGRVETMMLNVECAENDAIYLKALLSESCHLDQFERGQFIPEGIHLMASVDTLKALMSAQNKYLDDVVNVPVVGLPPSAFLIPESDEDKTSKLMNMIDKTELFWHVEETPQSGYLGKYHFITDAENEEKAKYFADNTLKHWIALNLEEKEMIKNFPEARRTAMPSASPMVGNYAAALKLRMEDENEEDLARKLPEKAKRRRTNIIHFGPEDFPVIEGSKSTPKSNKQRKKTQEAGPSEGTVSDSEVSDLTEYQRKLEKSEANLQAQIQATSESTDRKLIAMSNEHSASMEKQATTFKTMLDEQAAANTAMLEKLTQANTANQVEMREMQRQDKISMETLIGTMMAKLKEDLSTMIQGNQQQNEDNQGEKRKHQLPPLTPPRENNEEQIQQQQQQQQVQQQHQMHQQQQQQAQQQQQQQAQQQYQASHTEMNTPLVYHLRPNGGIGHQVTPPPAINPNHQGGNQLQQAAQRYLQPSSFAPGFSPPPSMLAPAATQDTNMSNVQNGQQFHSQGYGNANMEHSPSRGASN